MRSVWRPCCPWRWFLLTAVASGYRKEEQDGAGVLVVDCVAATSTHGRAQVGVLFPAMSAPYYDVINFTCAVFFCLNLFLACSVTDELVRHPSCYLLGGIRLRYCSVSFPFFFLRSSRFFLRPSCPFFLLRHVILSILIFSTALIQVATQIFLLLLLPLVS